MMKNSRKHILVSGTVQGVGFRYWTEGRARAYRLSGWVRNLRDGRVEVVVEGSEKELNQFLHELNHGPGGAQVSNLQLLDEPYQAEFRSFEILPSSD